jgi:hypothetical protein
MKRKKLGNSNEVASTNNFFKREKTFLVGERTRW